MSVHVELEEAHACFVIVFTKDLVADKHVVFVFWFFISLTSWVLRDAFERIFYNLKVWIIFAYDIYLHVIKKSDHCVWNWYFSRAR